MKKMTVLILILALAGLVRNSAAVSPMPFEELKPSPAETVCVIHIVHVPDHGKGILGEESTSTLVFKASMLKSDVLEKVENYISHKLNEGNVSEFKLECKFPKY